MTNPSVFLSYSHDSVAHKAWVRKLAEDLRGQGISSSQITAELPCFDVSLDLIRRWVSLSQRLPRQHKLGHRSPASAR